jgi:hypothetical protein
MVCFDLIFKGNTDNIHAQGNRKIYFNISLCLKLHIYY